MRAIVTGGAGFIGSAVVRHLIGAGTELVLNVDKLTYAGNLDSLRDVDGAPAYRFSQLDIADGEVMARLFAEYRPTTVFHLAAESHVDRSIDGPGEFVRTNVVGTFALLQAATLYWRNLDAAERERFRFVHVSTDEVFGSLGASGYFDEETPYRPNSPYSATKAASDHLARAWHHTYCLPVVTTNCSNNYGPYQFPEKLIPLVTLNALAGHPLPVYGTGANVRDWLHVADHARGLLRAAEAGEPGRTYVIGSRSERTNLDVVRAICHVLDEVSPSQHIGRRDQLITYVQDRPGHDHRYAIDPARIENELGWKATVPFDEGLRSTVIWYLENADWVEGVQSGEYQRQRLGLG
jgi:dTDP-glucose 4,6-dehydratase